MAETTKINNIKEHNLKIARKLHIYGNLRRILMEILAGRGESRQLRQTFGLSRGELILLRDIMWAKLGLRNGNGRFSDQLRGLGFIIENEKQKKKTPAPPKEDGA